jgi:hypothetical protein
MGLIQFADLGGSVAVSPSAIGTGLANGIREKRHFYELLIPPGPAPEAFRDRGIMFDKHVRIALALKAKSAKEMVRTELKRFR